MLLEFVFANSNRLAYTDEIRPIIVCNPDFRQYNIAIRRGKIQNS